MATQPETAPLDRLLDPLAEALSPEAARSIVELRAAPDVQARIDELGDKCNEGTLSEQETREYDHFVRAIDLITILQLKARTVLENANGS